MSDTDKMVEYYNQFKVTCKCGHYAYIDKKLEFKDKLKKEINK